MTDHEYLSKLQEQITDVYEKSQEVVVKSTKYKPVAGRRKLPEGKKARAENKGSTEFEMELVHYLTNRLEEDEQHGHVFRSPASKTPVDVWAIINGIEREFSGSYVNCYQCKTTRDTKPPRINKKEFEDFRTFCAKINAKAYWVDRWKKNKNVYIRRIRGIDISGEFYPVNENFS